MVVTLIQIKDAKWVKELSNIESICQLAANAVWRHQGILEEKKEVTIVLADDGLIQELNYKFRSKNEPTNVLSFPNDDCADFGNSDLPSLGDVILAFETIKKEVIGSFSNHVSHLVVHGCLHLLGYDHIKEKQAEKKWSR